MGLSSALLCNSPHPPPPSSQKKIKVATNWLKWPNNCLEIILVSTMKKIKVTPNWLILQGNCSDHTPPLYFFLCSPSPYPQEKKIWATIKKYTHKDKMKFRCSVLWLAKNLKTKVIVSY